MGKFLSGIDGERFPDLENKQPYSIKFTERIDTSFINDNEIIWQLYWAKDHKENEYTKVPASTSIQKKGRVVSYQFYENLVNKNLQLQATYKDETVQLHITPKSDGKEKIIDLFFLDVEYKIREKDNLKYMNTVNLQIYTLNMLGKYVDFKIYDIVNGEEKEVYKSEKPLKIEQKNGIVKTKQSIILTPFMSMKAQKDMSASEHIYKIKIWQSDNETNFYEEELKVKNEVGKMEVPQDSQTPVKTGTSEPSKKEEEKKSDGKCFCEKEFSVDNIKAFYKSKNLFTHKDCPLPSDQKTYAEFTKALNKAMKDYDLNTCLRKAHFLAQIQVESDRLNTTIEYATGWDYDHSTHFENYNRYLLFKRDPKAHKDYGTSKIKRGYNRYLECLKHGHNIKGYGPKYKGKGLLQLTWRDTYEAYFKFIDKNYIETPEIIAKNLFYSCDSSTWYWRYQSKWGDLNIAADRDDIYYISIGVNGGFNHFDERIANLKTILKLMKVKEQCKNVNSLKKEIGKYTFLTSKMKDTQYGKDHKETFEKYDDK